jgi:sugar phosphate isomerase/epimerase
MIKTCCGWLYTLAKYGFPPAFDKIQVGIEKAAEWGFGGIELGAVGEPQLMEMLAHQKQIKASIDACGVQLVNFCTVLPEVASLDPKTSAHALELFAMGAELGAALGAQLLHADSYEVPLSYVGETPGEAPIHFGAVYRGRAPRDFDWDRVWDHLVESMRCRAEIAAKLGLPLGVELRLGEAISTTDAWLRLAEHVGLPNFGVIFDTAHLYAQKEILALSVEKLKDRIFYIHAADNDGLTNQHLAPGEGTIDWAALFDALHKYHFDGYVAMDIGEGDLETAYPKAKQFIETFL